jgi:hypothetical protein
MKKVLNIDKKFADDFLIRVSENLYAIGLLTDDDIESKHKLIAAIKRIFEHRDIDNLVIDYTDSILSKAREFKNKREYNYARVFYATFFEHEINELIHLYCIRKKIDANTQKDIIQSVNTYGKYSWLLEIMSYPKFNKIHKITIKSLADNRNSFIHYKWKENPKAWDFFDKEKYESDINKEFESIENAVKYFKNYLNRIKYKGKKTQINTIIKKLLTKE